MNKNTKISQVMSTSLVCVRPDDPMTKVRETLKDATFHHLPVVKDEQIVGILSSTDVNQLESTFSFFKNEKTEAYNSAVFNSLLVSDAMHTPLETIQEDESIENAYRLFKKNTFHCLPVLNRSNTLVGLITPYDLLKFAFEQAI